MVTAPHHTSQFAVHLYTHAMLTGDDQRLVVAVAVRHDRSANIVIKNNDVLFVGTGLFKPKAA
jgi:hypothetical protein